MIMHIAYKKKLGELKFSLKALKRVEPLFSLIESHEYTAFERETALLFIESVKKIKNAELTPKQADEYFTILGILIEPKDKLKLSKEVQDIIFVGELFHDTKKRFPPEIEEAAREAVEVLVGHVGTPVKVPARVRAL